MALSDCMYRSGEWAASTSGNTRWISSAMRNGWQTPRYSRLTGFRQADKFRRLHPRRKLGM